MAYRFRAGDRSVQQTVRRVAREQIDGALAAIAAKHPDKATHEVRKACKKLRALFRLVRPSFAGRARENAEFRDISRLLSGTRDAAVMLDTFDLLAAQAPEDDATASPLDALRSRFADGVAQAAKAAGKAPLQEARARLEAARERIGDWVVASEGWDALDAGLRRTVRQARKAVRTVTREPTALHYHELRKAMKDHWYHTRLLVPLWPEVMEARSAELTRLADLLGLHHDISVFEARLGGALPHAATAAAARSMLTLADGRRLTLEREIGPLVARLLVQRPRALAKSWNALWQIWHGPAGAEVREDKT